jgi:hypothetical protein
MILFLIFTPNIKIIKLTISIYNEAEPKKDYRILRTQRVVYKNRDKNVDTYPFCLAKPHIPLSLSPRSR